MEAHGGGIAWAGSAARDGYSSATIARPSQAHLSWCGVVWDLKSPPEAVLRNEQRLGAKVIEKAAAELAATFNVESISAALMQSLASTAPGLADSRERLLGAQHRAVELLGNMHLPHLPTYDEVRERACRMFAKTQSLDAIVERAHRIPIEGIYARLAAAC